jgi:sugar lactone lactonase YvrE
MAAAAGGCGTTGGGGGGDDTPGDDGGVRPGMTNGVSTLAGYAQPGYLDGDRDVNLFNNPTNVAYGPDGKLYVADFDNGKLRVVDMVGNASTVISKDTFVRPFGLAFVGDTLYAGTDNDSQGQHDPDGSTVQQSGAVWRIDTGSRTATAVADKIGRPRGLAGLEDGRLAVADYAHHVIEILDPGSGTLTTLAGSWDQKGDADGAGASAKFNTPYGIVQRSDGKLVVADQGNGKLRLVGLDGTVETLVGGLDMPQGVAITSSGDLFVTERNAYDVVKVSGTSISVVAGDGTAGYKDDDDKLAAEFFGLEGISVKPDGSAIFVADGTGGEDVPYNRVRLIKN